MSNAKIVYILAVLFLHKEKWDCLTCNRKNATKFISILLSKTQWQVLRPAVTARSTKIGNSSMNKALNSYTLPQINTAFTTVLVHLQSSKLAQKLTTFCHITLKNQNQNLDKPILFSSLSLLFPILSSHQFAHPNQFLVWISLFSSFPIPNIPYSLYPMPILSSCLILCQSSFLPLYLSVTTPYPDARDQQKEERQQFQCKKWLCCSSSEPDKQMAFLQVGVTNTAKFC